jgi:hypothetical protein
MPLPLRDFINGYSDFSFLKGMLKLINTPCTGEQLRLLRRRAAPMSITLHPKKKSKQCFFSPFKFSLC